MSTQTVSEYLIQCIADHRVDHVFGVPGDYVLGLVRDLEVSPLHCINTCDEQGAGFAADAYARLKGLGVVCITYGVGGLKVANTTAQAYAEKLPVVVISGAPGLNEQSKDALLHHRIRGFDTQFNIFQELTVASTVIDNPETAQREIDRVFAAALSHKRPVYIEVPRDMLSKPIIAVYTPPLAPEKSDTNALHEALHEAEEVIRRARQPVLLAGVELRRFGLGDAFVEFSERTNIPYAVTLLSKASVPEAHPYCMGVYNGAMSREDVREYVESSDCLIILGEFLTDFNLGIYTARLDQKRLVYATSEKTSIGYHSYEQVYLPAFLQGLMNAQIERPALVDLPRPEEVPPFEASDEPVTNKGLFECLTTFVDEKTVIVADTGDAMLSSAHMYLRHSGTLFTTPAYYASLGYGVPAGIGAQLAAPDLRPLVLVGDGAFQMTGMELSQAARYGLNPIVVVLNNCGYGTERPMVDGAFNDVPLWKFSLLPDLFGVGQGFDVYTEQQLVQAINAARTNTDTYSILDVHLDPYDFSPVMRRLASSLGERIRQ